ncbi:hypothetical protein CR513_05995, partial [Mucuna pruriens]
MLTITSPSETNVITILTFTSHLLLSPTSYCPQGIDYFTKWIEIEFLAKITTKSATKFVYNFIVCRFGILEVVISNNDTQFTNSHFREFLVGLKTKHHFSSIKHLQTNDQVEATNKVIEPFNYQICFGYIGPFTHSTIRKMPFCLTCGIKVTIPMKTKGFSWRAQHFKPTLNDNTC